MTIMETEDSMRRRNLQLENCEEDVDSVWIQHQKHNQCLDLRQNTQSMSGFKTKYTISVWI